MLSPGWPIWWTTIGRIDWLPAMGRERRRVSGVSTSSTASEEFDLVSFFVRWVSRAFSAKWPDASRDCFAAGTTFIKRRRRRIKTWATSGFNKWTKGLFVLKGKKAGEKTFWSALEDGRESTATQQKTVNSFQWWQSVNISDRLRCTSIRANKVAGGQPGIKRRHHYHCSFILNTQRKIIFAAFWSTMLRRLLLLLQLVLFSFISRKKLLKKKKIKNFNWGF